MDVILTWPRETVVQIFSLHVVHDNWTVEPNLIQTHQTSINYLHNESFSYLCNPWTDAGSVVDLHGCLFSTWPFAPIQENEGEV